jgi:hypothetical protein
MLGLDQICKIFIPGGLDLSIFGINDLLVPCWLNAKARRVGPGLFGFAYCFNYTGWRETSMPTSGKIYVVWLV